MTYNTKGEYTRVLAIDCETSGIAFGSDDPSYNVEDGTTYQAVSWGLVVADASTFKPIEELYVEVQWNGVSMWDAKAERVHGLSKNYLQEYGVPQEEAVLQIGSLILSHWGPTSPVVLLGHNVGTFDIWFLKRMMRAEGIELRFGARHIDTSSIGITTFGTHTAPQLFQAVGIEMPEKHNALEDARASLCAARTVKQLWNTFVTPQLG